MSHHWCFFSSRLDGNPCPAPHKNHEFSSELRSGLGAIYATMPPNSQKDFDVHSSGSQIGWIWGFAVCMHKGAPQRLGAKEVGDIFDAGAVQELMGEFVIGWFDGARQLLRIASDKSCTRPSFVYYDASNILVANSQRILRENLMLAPSVSPLGLAQCWRGDWTSPPHTVWNGIQKIGPGTLVSISSAAAETRCYHQPQYLPTIESVEPTEIFDAIKERLDVCLMGEGPIVDALLSSGVDSNAVVSALHLIPGLSVNATTFRSSAEYDESPIAVKSAKHFGIPIRVIDQPANTLLDSIAALVRIRCEPYGHSSSTALMSMLETMQGNSQLLFTGDGGDGPFYSTLSNRDAKLLAWGRRLSLPARFLSTLLTGTYGAVLYGRYAARKLVTGVESLRSTSESQLLHNLCPISEAENSYLLRRTAFRDNVISPALIEPSTLPPFDPAFHSLATVSKFYNWNPEMYAKSAILADEFGLRTRSPLAHYEFHKLIMRLSPTKKGGKKQLLREAIRPHVAADIISAPKIGLMSRSKESMVDNARAIFKKLDEWDDSSMNQLFRMDRMRTLVLEHIAGRTARTTLVYHLLAFGYWIEQFQPDLRDCL